MTARVLVVDDVLPNRMVLEAKLMAEYYDVTCAEDGFQALEEVKRRQPDIILLDVMMPGMDGFEVCRRLKADEASRHIPVILVTALDQPEDRVTGLEAGADDFLTKPVDDVVLLARVKNLVRIKAMTDELRQRCKAAGNVSLTDDIENDAVPYDPRVLLVEDDPGVASLVRATLEEFAHVDVESTAENVVMAAQEQPYDLAIISLGLRSVDGLRLCSQFRTMAATRHMPLLVLSDRGDHAPMARALDMGVNDAIILPIDRNELKARTKAQIRQKRYQDSLRQTIDRSFELALVDPMTGLYNRRYFESHLSHLMEQTAQHGRPLVVMILDLDHFKSVNDTYGHAAGDEVLRQFGRCLSNYVRSVDTPFRIGGEEFVVVMPNTTLEIGERVADRLRVRVAKQPFAISVPPGSIPVTVSIGLSVHDGASCDGETLLARADEALYDAKRSGRNRVSAAAA